MVEGAVDADTQERRLRGRSGGLIIEGRSLDVVESVGLSTDGFGRKNITQPIDVAALTAIRSPHIGPQALALNYYLELHLSYDRWYTSRAQ